MLDILVVPFIFLIPYSESSIMINKLDMSRIAGGGEIDITQAPYQLSLEHNKGPPGFIQVCGASVIGRFWAITAAHCVDGRIMGRMRLRSGISNLDQDGDIHNLTYFKVHPTYVSRRGTRKNDVAVLKVYKQFDYSDSVQPINLAHTTPSVGTPAMVSGWGMLNFREPDTSQLQQVTVSVLEQQVCLDAYGGRFLAGMLCAGTKLGGKDACKGDSGGPLVANNELVGIVSWGDYCALAEYPGVYVDVAYFLPWIISITGDI